MKGNYEIPVDMLKEHYWKKHIMIDVHYAKMMNLPVATYKSTSLRSFMLLRSLGENDNQMQILSMWKPKLPRNTLLELEKMKTENEEWTVKTFRELQKRHIKAQEACDIWMKLFHKKPEESPKPLYTSRLPPPAAASSTNSTRESLLSNNGFQSRFKKKCIFCGKDTGATNTSNTQTSNWDEEDEPGTAPDAWKKVTRWKIAWWLERYVFTVEKRTNITNHFARRSSAMKWPENHQTMMSNDVLLKNP